MLHANFGIKMPFLKKKKMTHHTYRVLLLILCTLFHNGVHNSVVLIGCDHLRNRRLGRRSRKH